MTKVEEFEQLRPLLFSIAYRILGSVADAEDAVQESWLRYAASSTEPASAKAFLSAVVTRISINVLRSARVRREAYVGPWFPEPLLEDPYQDPVRSAELADSLSMAVLLLLERLSPSERAVFVLRDVFGFSFAEVAAALGRSEAACRQLAVRARRHMDDGRPRFDADRKDRDELAERFFAGIYGAQKVARLLGALVAPFVEIGGWIEQHDVNGQPGAIFHDRDGKVINTWALDILDGQIQAIRTVSNPDKLGHVGPVADAWAIVRRVIEARRPDQRPRTAPGQPRNAPE
jgi:RNA polymerase sigma-70 factor, ECF subfamily